MSSIEIRTLLEELIGVHGVELAKGHLLEKLICYLPQETTEAFVREYKETSHRHWILERLKPHVCTEYSCGFQPTGRNPQHDGCMELLSNDFIEATQRIEGVYVAPD